MEGRNVERHRPRLSIEEHNALTQVEANRNHLRVFEAAGRCVMKSQHFAIGIFVSVNVGALIL